ncbi:DEKNAAC103216 [Brettanomyces naardenensis]|uniref:DEKNAAC103216 n=1 Tax=Brettanomyces naardenensis TaxID=13370 RepID=A0A448YMQ2_BRENA|nr:DEKNAAC103216 [Brettanomyces naardenensis]
MEVQKLLYLPQEKGSVLVFGWSKGHSIEQTTDGENLKYRHCTLREVLQTIPLQYLKFL